MDQHVYENEYVQVPPPQRRSQGFVLVPAFGQIAEDEYIPQNNFAYAEANDDDQYEYDYEADAVYFD
jgi:hypothetical protein